ncbi:MAG TPA: hypothetical protein VFM44_12890, partial [Gemmatimonadota bacterium]|nr:hypothetical protein [Gemmatimonadota bacterium]
GGENPGPEVPGPENPGPPDPDPVDTPLRVESVTLSPDSLTVALQETAQLNVIVRDTDGAVIADPQVVFTVTGLKDGTVGRHGLVTGLVGGCGVGRVWAWSGGVNSNAAVITVGSPSAPGCRVVGSVTLLPAFLRVRVNDTAQLTVIVRDMNGAVIPSPEVVFSTSRLTVGTVDSTGLVTGLPGDECVFGTVTASFEGVISNTATIAVGSSAVCDVGGWDDY